MGKHHLLAFTNPVAGREADFNRWYDEQHVPDLLAVPGFVSAQRFRLTDATGQDNPGWTYLALYEIEADDPDAVMAEVRSRLGTAAMAVSETLDPATPMGLLAEAITTRVIAKKA
jgi:hypothetical protein